MGSTKRRKNPSGARRLERERERERSYAVRALGNPRFPASEATENANQLQRCHRGYLINAQTALSATPRFSAFRVSRRCLTLVCFFRSFRKSRHSDDRYVSLVVLIQRLTRQIKDFLRVFSRVSCMQTIWRIYNQIPS